MSPATAFEQQESLLPMLARMPSLSRRVPPDSVVADKISGRGPRPKVILVMVEILLVIAVITGTAIYQDQIAPFQRPVVVVGKAEVPMSYFLRRARLSGADPMSVLHALVKEQLINQLAPLPPYNIVLGDDDADQFLRGVASGAGESLSEEDFQEWLRQQVSETGLSTAEFLRLARTNMLTQRLTALLGERIPTVAEQLHLHVIVTSSLDDAQRFRSRLAAGEDASSLSRDVSATEGSASHTGWFPRAALAPVIAQAAFQSLAIGEASAPLPLKDGHFAVVTVLERALAREIDEATLQQLRASALEDWVAQQWERHKVEFRGLTGDSYDSETDAWVRWQLGRVMGAPQGQSL